MRIETSIGVLKPVGELNALRSSVSISVVGRSSGVGGALEGRRHFVRVGEVVEQALRRAQRGDLVGDREVGDAAGAVDLGPAEIVGRHVFAERALDDAPGR